jgi:uncharacterized protein DUF1592/uncharacterized protein DUF1588/uncharacterized protein DUF1587/uncharacterized protein DUF1585/uncharacterized protein DUF1595/cbb3-type cytochrome c oxidase subunit III
MGELMKRVGAIFLLAGLAGLAAGAGGQAPPQEKEFETLVRPLLATYCMSCHGGAKPKAKLDLSGAKGEGDLAHDPGRWLDLLKQLKTRAMPPDDAKKALPDGDREKLAAWIDAALDRVDERAPRDPGRVTLRRLNRAEYNNTIRDLVGLDLRPADDFPPDDVGEGFDTVGDILTLPPLLLDKYVDAADRILDKAMVASGPVEFLEKRVEAETLTKEKAANGTVELKCDQGLSTITLVVPADGRYELRLRGRQDKSPDGRAVVGVRVDGVDTALVTVPAEEGVYATSFELQRGERRLQVHHSAPKAIDAKKETNPDTRLHLDWIEVAGPERSASHRRLFSVEGEDRDAARTILERFATRAFRRPLAPGELDRVLKLFDAGRKEGKGFAAAVRQGLWSVLVSPHFLFRVERDSADRDEAGSVRLNGWELASRLSYFLWSTMPDPALLDLAASGTLRDPQVLREQARRMLADPRSRAFVDNFAGQWLGLRKLDQVQPDREMFPQFTEAVRRAMADEASYFFANLVHEDRSILELILADYTFVNEPLARIYGMKGITGDAMRRVPLPDANRGGVVTMAGILTLTSHPTRTSAVKRGKWILDEILGAPPPPPPPNVPELNEASKNRPDAKTLTLRQRLELHRADPQCFGCHRRMDVLGLGLENFDAIGRWREKDGAKAIDPSGTLPTGESFSSPGGMKKILAAAKEDFSRALTEKLCVYALGRTLERGDRRELKRMVEELRKHEYRFSALVESLVTSYPFRFRRPGGIKEVPR